MTYEYFFSHLCKWRQISQRLYSFVSLFIQHHIFALFKNSNLFTFLRYYTLTQNATCINVKDFMKCLHVQKTKTKHENDILKAAYKIKDDKNSFLHIGLEHGMTNEKKNYSCDRPS